MQDRQSYQIEGRVAYAVWPGGMGICARLWSPERLFRDQLYLGDPETGTVSVLAEYRYREWHRSRRG